MMANPIVVIVSFKLEKWKKGKRNHWQLQQSEKWICCSSPTGSLCIRFKKLCFLSVKTLRILAEHKGTELFKVGKWSLKNLVAVVMSSCLGARNKEPVLRGVLIVRICSAWCMHSPVSVTCMGAAWNNTMSAFFNLLFNLCFNATGDVRSASLLPRTFECGYFHWSKVFEMASHLN